MATKLIAISEKNYEELLQLGKMRSTFNDVISTLLENNKQFKSANKVTGGQKVLEVQK